MLSAASANGFQMVVSGAQAKALPDFQITNIQVLVYSFYYFLLLQYCSNTVTFVSFLFFFWGGLMLFIIDIIWMPLLMLLRLFSHWWHGLEKTFWCLPFQSSLKTYRNTVYIFKKQEYTQYSQCTIGCSSLTSVLVYDLLTLLDIQEWNAILFRKAFIFKETVTVLRNIEMSETECRVRKVRPLPEICRIG